MELRRCCRGIACSLVRRPGRCLGARRAEAHRGLCASLEEDQQGEEEEPEEAHRVPVPRGAVDHDLPGFERARGVEADQRGDEAEDAEDEVDSVDSGDEVEEMAAGVGEEEDVLQGELGPGDPLADEEDDAQNDGSGDPGDGGAGDGLAQAEPLVHDVDLVEHAAAGGLHGDGAEDEDDCVEPEDRRNEGWGPLVDVVVVGVEMAGVLADEEGADDGDEEHQVAGESEEDAHAVADEALARAAATVGTVVPVIVVAAATGALIGGRSAAGTVVVVFEVTPRLRLGSGRRDGCWHDGLSSHAMETAYSGLMFGIASVFHCGRINSPLEVARYSQG